MRVIDEDEINGLEPVETDDENAESRAGADSSEEDSDLSEDEDHGRKLPRKKVSVKALLEEVLDKIHNEKLDLTKKDQYSSFVSEHGELLASQTGDQDQPTALHIMAIKDKKDLPKLDNKMQPLIEFLAKRDKYLEIQNRSGHTSLFLAIEARKKEMVQWMCDARPDINRVLALTGSQKMNCLHAGINKRVKFLSYLIDKADPKTLTAKDEDGNTPLHLAVEYKRCKRDQLDCIKNIVEKADSEVLASGPSGDFNNSELSPYLYHRESVRKARDKVNKKAKEEADREKASSRHPNPRGPDKQNKEREPGQKETNSRPVDQLFEASDPANLPNMRFDTQPDYRTKYGGGTSAQAPSTVVSAAPDPHGHDQELYFDLSGNINTGVMTQPGLENLFSKLNFEDTLQYVCIPKISIQINRPSERAGASRRAARAKVPDEAGKRDLCYIFDRLRAKGVKTILSVIVDDSASPAHSDEAIEDALKTMDVEIWDWNRVDLCTEVIFKAAPKAREVHLYWSGNNAVLRGWSEEGGLKKLRELKKVHIHIEQGLESSARTKLNINEFQDRMEKLCPQVRVNPAWPDTRLGQLEANSVRNEEQGDHSTKHEWIQCMKDFRRLLFDAENNWQGPRKVIESIEEPIRVALVDDGVDVKDLEYTFIGGRTFCPRVEHQKLNNPYYISRSGHGTIMAKQIYLMCPRVEFYVLRLEDCPSEDATTLNLTAKSAAMAIRAAVRKKVHIISMSWTIDTPENEDERQDLDRAVIEAANANILMFCSAMDKGAKQTATYPSKATPNKIFTIGAANASGASVDYVGNLTNINYTFPGDKVEVDGGPTLTTSQEVVDGSSVATALAAGLAALILYCVQVRVLLASGAEKEKARRDFQIIKTHDGMKRAFSAIETTEESNHKFLKVWEVFGKHVEQKEHEDHEKWIELIADVGKRLCTKIYYT
ncbi:hypothetical protein F53441_5486 [Fusarium austroafricanum]|uniref:Peptidase S8/S53 domain-containing protein n=1 Tax=Fusarium austroafricanum TaxID=2364996 RepID=A0A8H4KHY3_9HYPO|nr:hypothetical protein F53441_5486 [Fusarium austroafricanum]